MNKQLTKPHEKNVRIDSPYGLLGVPPDAPCCCMCMGCCPMVKRRCARRLRDLTQ